MSNFYVTPLSDTLFCMLFLNEAYLGPLLHLAGIVLSRTFN